MILNGCGVTLFECFGFGYLDNYKACVGHYLLYTCMCFVDKYGMELWIYILLSVGW